MAIDGRKIAQSFRWQGQSLVRAFASLMDFTGSEGREYTEEILSRPIEDDMRADWEAVGADLWQAIRDHEARMAQGNKE